MSSAFRGPAIVLTVFMLAGCGWTGTTVPQGAMTQNQTHQASGSSGNLIYALTNKAIVVVAYPTWQIVASIPVQQPGSDNAICSDPNNGDVFVTETTGAVGEYAHGGTTQIATLGTAGFEPGGCSVDPISGNLAVAGYSGSSKAPMLIYPHATGNPTLLYSSQLKSFSYPAYDDAGDLFTSTSAKHGFRYAELKANDKTFSVIKPPSEFDFYVNKIQWDGSHVVFENWNARGEGTELYQLHISGRTATLVGSIQLQRADGNTFWMQDGSVFGPFAKPLPNHHSRAIAYWPYPAGGKQTSRFYGIANGKQNEIYDVTVSVAPSEPRIRK
jgi:hypothetical protein